jgi:hypothetical protein
VHAFGPTSLRAFFRVCSGGFFAFAHPRETDMRIACLLRGRIFLVFMFISSHLAIIGCNDNSRTSGTMVEESQETKARREGKIGSYKGGPSKVNAKAASKKK